MEGRLCKVVEATSEESYCTVTRNTSIHLWGKHLGASYLLEHFLSEHLQSEYSDEEEVHRSYFLAKPVQAVRLHLECDQRLIHNYKTEH